MNDRERFLACLLGEPIDRPPYWLFWDPWPTAWERWEREGKPADIKDHRTFMDPDQPPMPVPVNCGPCPRFEPRILEETEDWIIHVDGLGIKRRDLKHSMSMSQFLEFPVRDRRDWERLKEERFDPDHPDRLAGDWRELGAEWMRKGYPIQLGEYPSVSLYGGLRWLLGDEECLLAFYTDPGLVHDIMDHLTSVFLTVFEHVVRHIRVDMIHIWEDMCGRQGSLISPRHWDEFMAPNYRRIAEFARQHNIALLSVDTDGQPAHIIPNMLRAGVNYMLPCEVAAGCDVNAVRQRYPGLGMMGGIDKRALAQGKEAIDMELERIAPVLETGRYIPDLDHCVPDDVSWEDYCYYAEALKRLVGKS